MTKYGLIREKQLMMKLDTNKILVVKAKVNLPKIYTF